MKINGFKPTADIFKSYQKNNLGKNSPAKGSDEAGKGDSLQISSEAKAKREIETSLKEIPDVREDLVSRIKKDIQSGAYQPDANKIADGIIQERLLDKQI